MSHVAVLADKIAVERERPWADRLTARSLFEQLDQTAQAHPQRPGVSFQLQSGPKDRAETLTWREVRAQTVRAANAFRRLGITEAETVAYILPNCNEAAITLLAGATAGIVAPVNPLLDPAQIAAILRETGATVVVTLAPFPKTDLAERVARALADAPRVHTVLEVDLGRYLGPPKRWLVPFLRPKPAGGHRAEMRDFHKALAAERGDALSFSETLDDRFCARFHTGGTTGMPKVAQHRAGGILYNGWCGVDYMFTERDVLICPLPMFHVFAAYPVFMSCLVSGGHLVMPTPAGYRGDGVFDNFWKLIERWGVTFMIMVPTAASQLMARKVDADLSTLRYALCGSAPLPVELFRRFEKATGVTIMEGYGMTEATCLVSINPPHGERRIGSVGLPFPYTDVRILHCDEAGNVTRECDPDEVGEICVSNPGVTPGETYTDPTRNAGLYADGRWLRTGDLGRIDAEGYVWITGRAKDLIIRGGHNIDPALIEDVLAGHPDVAFVGAIGQPDAHSGEVPAAYVELVQGATARAEALRTWIEERIGERAALPRHLEVMQELPKTAVGKVFKPALRKDAIARVYDAALSEAGVPASVAEVEEDRQRGLIAVLRRDGPDASDAAVDAALGGYARPWRWQDG